MTKNTRCNIVGIYTPRPTNPTSHTPYTFAHVREDSEGEDLLYTSEVRYRREEQATSTPASATALVPGVYDT